MVYGKLNLEPPVQIVVQSGMCKRSNALFACERGA